MRVLLVGKGGREHALAWKLQQTAEHVFVVPGNGGTARIGQNVSNIGAVDMHDFPRLVQLAQDLAIDLVLPGPDDVVVDGISDAFDQGKPEIPDQASGTEREANSSVSENYSQYSLFCSFKSGSRARGVQNVCERLYGSPRYSHGQISQFQRLCSCQTIFVDC